MFIYPYANASQSIQNLKELTGAKSIRLENSKFRGSPSKNVVNWGNSTPNEEVSKCNLLNSPELVGICTNKLNFFERMDDTINIPEWTTDPQEAYKWMEKDNVVLARSSVSGHSGRGINVLEGLPDWDNINHSSVRFYSKYIPKKSEWRVHIFRGDIIYIQKKGTPNGERAINYRIQNRENGFTYLKGYKELPEQVPEQALSAFNLTGLDFGAVDVIYNAYRNKAYVLEMNTAPGLTGTTVRKYAKAFLDFFGEKGKLEGSNLSEPFIPDDVAIADEAPVEEVSREPRPFDYTQAVTNFTNVITSEPNLEHREQMIRNETENISNTIANGSITNQEHAQYRAYLHFLNLALAQVRRGRQNQNMRSEILRANEVFGFRNISSDRFRDLIRDLPEADLTDENIESGN